MAMRLRFDYLISGALRHFKCHAAQHLSMMAGRLSATAASYCYRVARSRDDAIMHDEGRDIGIVISAHLLDSAITLTIRLYHEMARRRIL